MKVKEVMTHKVIAVRPDQSVLSAAQLMMQKAISGLPVIDAGGTLVGMLTEGDFLRRSEIGTEKRRPRWLEFLVGPGRLAEEYVRACGRKVAEIMSPDPCTVSDDDTLETVVDLMEKRHIKRVPVVRDGTVIGIVSRSDLLRGLIGRALAQPAAAASDNSIRAAVLTQLEGKMWAPQVAVAVENGIVDLSGAIMDERERQALIVAAENIPGVRSVRDHLVWVEPMSGMAVLPRESGAATDTAA